ncbi:MAG TPA: M20/M25/M40 family metallo-hydrolase [Trueperaceae bacterium]|nr:M20/M25/M40 family metallo-hydrolase [Trueperaceae bacterium]
MTATKHLSLDEVLTKLYEHIDENFDAYLEDIRTLVRQPSVAAQDWGIKEAATMVRDMIQELGSTDVRLVEYESGSPVVYGRVTSENPDAGTLIVYCLYDVQPPEPLEEWNVEPFSADIVDVAGYGPSVVGRGVTNSKGPLVNFFSAVKSMQAVLGYTPLNLIFVIEGEEEVGSQNLKKFVPEYAEELRAADGVYLPGLRQDENGKPKVLLGNKGIAYFELEIKGGDWGGPRSVDIHGMNGAWVDNPVWRLVNALSTLRSPDGKVLVKGFYDDVLPPGATDRQLLDRLLTTFDTQMFADRADVARFMDGLEGRALMEKFLFTPSFNIDGIYGGYTGPGQKTIVPYRVRVKIDVRMVPNMNGDKIISSVLDHLAEHGFPEVTVTFSEVTPFSKSDPDSDLAQAAVSAMDKAGHTNGEIWPIYPGSGPAYLFTNEYFKIPFIAYGLGHGGLIHAPNEYAVVEGLKDNIKSVCATFIEYLRIAEAKKGNN